MTTGLKILIETLRRCADNLEAGNSNIDEQGCIRVLQQLDLIANGDTVMSKREACDYLGVSRASFDLLISNDYIPHGKKLYDGSKSLFWYKSDLDDYLSTLHNKN